MTNKFFLLNFFSSCQDDTGISMRAFLFSCAEPYLSYKGIAK